MTGLAVQQVAFSEGELPLACGCSRRAAKLIVREIGRRLGGRRVVLREDLVDYLRRLPQGRPPPRPKLDALPPCEFQIGERSR